MTDSTMTYGALPQPIANGNYYTTKPSFLQGPSKQIGTEGALKETPPRVTANFAISGQPIATHRTWSSLIWTFQSPENNLGETISPPPAFSEIVPLDPWQCAFFPTGMTLSYVNTLQLTNTVIPEGATCTPYPSQSDITLNGPANGLWEGFQAPYPLGNEDITITISNFNATESQVDSYSDWMVTTQLADQTDPTKILNVSLVEGSPYIYFDQPQTVSTVTIGLASNISRIFYCKDGTIFFIREDARTTYGIFAPGATIDINFTNTTLEYADSITLTNASYFSIATLPDQLVTSFITIQNPQGLIVPAPSNCSSIPQINRSPCGPTPYPQGTPASYIPLYIEGGNAAISISAITQDFFGKKGGAFDSSTGLIVGGYDYLTNVPEFKNLLARYEKYAMAFPTATSLSYNYNQSAATVSVTYDITTTLKTAVGSTLNEAFTNSTLMALKPHQYKYATLQLLPDHTYSSVRGTLQTIKGTTFTATYDYPSFSPLLMTENTSFSDDELAQINTFLNLIVIDGEINYAAQYLGLYDNTIPLADCRCPTYAGGKVMGRLAQIIPIANYVGRQDVSEVIENYLRSVLRQWFHSGSNSGTFDPTTDYQPDPLAGGCCANNSEFCDANTVCNKRYFYYDTLWNTLIGYPADFDADTELNDHHFHYGYFIHTMGILALFGSEDTQQWARKQDMVNLLIKDVANWDKTDTAFPFLRIYNAFAGQSFADGHAFAAGNNQESSSEAMNCWAGILMWGEATEQKEIRDLGVFLYTAEFHSIREYWLDMDGGNFPQNIWYANKGQNPATNPLTPVYNQYNYNRPMVNIVWGTKTDFSSFFGGAANFIFGIQMLPITPASYYWGHFQQKLQAIFNHIPAANQLFIDQGVVCNSTITFNQFYYTMMWTDIFSLTKSIVAPAMGVQFLKNLGNYYPQNIQLLIDDLDITNAWSYDPGTCSTNDDCPPSAFTESSELFSTNSDAAGYNDFYFTQVSENPTFQGEAGESKVHTYFYVHLNKQLGTVTDAYYSDALFFKAFLNNSIVQFIIYNAGDTPQTYNIYSKATGNVVQTMTVEPASVGDMSASNKSVIASTSTIPLSNSPLSIQNNTILTEGEIYQSYSVPLFTAQAANFTLTSGTLPDGLILSPVGVIFGLPTTAGTFTFTVQTAAIVNSGPDAESATFSITINAAASSIVITTANLPNGVVGLPYAGLITASQTATFTIIYGGLPNGLILSPDGHISGTPTASGSIGVTIQATDAENSLLTASEPLTILINEPTANITFTTSNTLPDGVISIDYTLLQLEVSESDILTNETLVFTLVDGTGLPTGMTLSSDGIISGTPLVGGNFNLTIQVSTSNESNTLLPTVQTHANFSLYIDSPTITFITTSLPQGAVGEIYTTTLQVQEGNMITSESYAFSVDSLPIGLSLDSLTGVLSGTPLESGNFAPIFSVQTSNVENTNLPIAQSTQLFPLVIDPIIITTKKLPAATADFPYSAQLNVSPASAIFRLITGPSWISLSEDGALSGTPTQTGNISITVVADFPTDTNYTFESAPVTLSIIVQSAISITTTSLSSGFIGQVYSQNLIASQPMTQFSASSLPEGLNLVNGVIEGKPTQVGIFNVIINASVTFTISQGAGHHPRQQKQNASVTLPLVIKNKSSLSVGAIIGIVIGSLAGLVIVLFIIFKVSMT